MANKKGLMIFLIINVVAVLSAAILFASFAWYVPDSPSGYMLELTADSVYSIFFTSEDVDITGDLVPAVAMEGAVAEGKSFDVTKTYDEDPNSYVSEKAQEIYYATMLTSRSADTLLVEYEWYVNFENQLEERIDPDEFVINVKFFNIEREEEILPDATNRFYLTPIGDTNTVEIRVEVYMYFAKVDELMDPRLKDSLLWVTVDVRRILELEKNGYLNISFNTDSADVEGEFYPGQEPGENPIIYIKDFAYTGSTSYYVDAAWEIIHNYNPETPQELYIVNIRFFNKVPFKEIFPEEGKYNFSAHSDILMRVEVSYSKSLDYILQNYPEMLESRHNVIIMIGTAP